MSARSLRGARQFQRVTRQRPGRAPAATFTGACVSESFDGSDSVSLVGHDLTWKSWRRVVTSAGGSITNGTGVVGIEGNELSVTTATFPSDGTDAGTPTLPLRQHFCFNLCTDTVGADDIRVACTVTGIGPTGTGAGDFSVQSWRLLARVGEATGTDWTDGDWIFWEFVYTLNGDDSRTLELTCWTNSNSFTAIDEDTGTPSTLAEGDELAIEVSGTGTATVVRGKLNDVTLIELAGTDLTDFLTAESLTAGDLPGFRCGGTGMQATPAQNVSVWWSALHDNVVKLDDFSACPL